MECRACGACCIAISISSPIPGMPNGKVAGQRCIHLQTNDLCAIFGQPDRPKVCSSFQADQEFCGSTREEALIQIGRFEQITSPTKVELD